MPSRAVRSKALRFLPLTFLAGTHGFALFAPYVAVVLAALHLRNRHRARNLVRSAAVFQTTPAAAPDPGASPLPA